MVSSHGAMRFDHAQYRQMAEKGPMVLKSYEFSDLQVTMVTAQIAIVTYRARQETARRGDAHGSVQEVHDSSTWLKDDSGRWKCVMHTEAAADDESR